MFSLLPFFSTSLARCFPSVADLEIPGGFAPATGDDSVLVGRWLPSTSHWQPFSRTPLSLAFADLLHPSTSEFLSEPQDCLNRPSRARLFRQVSQRHRNQWVGAEFGCRLARGRFGK